MDKEEIQEFLHWLWTEKGVLLMQYDFDSETGIRHCDESSYDMIDQYLQK